ncbi:MAG: molybdenum cofactor guanylyltransferase [Acidobacteriota bacterium]
MTRQIEGFILAGGNSSRMGRDKSVLIINGRTLIEHAAEALASVADPVYIVGNIDAAKTSLPIVLDVKAATETRGSIVGLYTAAVKAKTKWMAILACDLPVVGTDLLRILSELIPAENDNACRAILPEQPNGLLQPLCGFYAVGETRKAIEQMLANGNWRLRNLAAMLNVRIVDFAELAHLPNSQDFFLNVNTPDDYEAARAIRQFRKELF